MDKDGYIYNKSGSKLVLMHRLIINAPKGMVVDHINHITNDNRKENLRICTYGENAMNSKETRASSGIRGVYWYAREEKWSAEIGLNKKIIHLGLFDSKEKAIQVRKQAEKKYYGEYAYKEE